MKANKIILFTLICGLACSHLSAQFARAEKKFDTYQYADAIPLYKEVIQKDSSNLQAWIRLADCYRLTNQVQEAENCYSKIVGRPDTPPITKYYYAQTLLTNDNHERAKFWFKEYSVDDPTDKRAKDFLATLDFWDEYMADSNRYTVKKININSEDADYGAVPYKDGILFSSSRLCKGADRLRDSWTGNRFMTVYYAKGSEGFFSEPQVFAKPIQSKFNNGPICVNSNESEIYFTRNNTDQETEDNVKIDKLKIFSIVMENGKYSSTKSFQYNNDNYSCAHPVLSPDGTKLIFSSDMPGGYGGMDLWMCEKVTEGWGAPQNLGPDINTKGNELFPTINNDGKFYFSSNGLGGLGGLDIFTTSFVNGKFKTPVNLGAPINSSDDDFSLFFDSQKRWGYFSSNRHHQGYNDDIYAFASNEILLSGIILDKLTNQPLSETEITIFDKGIQREQLKTDKEGNFKILVIPGNDYKIVAENEKHINDTTSLHVDNERPSDGVLSVTMSLSNKLAKNDLFVMKNILYDFNKYDIRADAAIELDRVITVLKENPNVKIELSSHTDCRAGDRYNMNLSEKRAKAAVKYLVMNGIDKNRLIAKGYGKTKLLINCDCDSAGGKACTAEDHQANRRTEIKVLSE